MKSLKSNKLLVRDRKDTRCDYISEIKLKGKH